MPDNDSPQEGRRPESLLNDASAGRGPSGDAPEIVDSLIHQTFELGASDMHLLPMAHGLRVHWRIDGVLHHAGDLPKAVATHVVTRLKVLADLITYDNHKPQEGRLRTSPDRPPVRVTTMPTLFGEQIVVRVLPGNAHHLGRLGDLGMPESAYQVLSEALRQTTGAILIAGPAGSGKSTTAYALIREIAAASTGARSIASLEDPVEIVLPGVAQAQAAPHAGFDMHTGLRALVRQDPEVILLGEIRDDESAKLAFQAALTGQLLVTTFHAGDIATAITRLIDMGIPPYVLKGATQAIVVQRLLRRLCECSTPDCIVGCEECRGAGHQGRVVIAEAADIRHPDLADEIRGDYDRQRLHGKLHDHGSSSLREQAEALVEQGVTSRLELERVLGFPHKD
ncbi:putative type II secretion system protein E [Posidoniimonas polymericola]|uniref:Putative type II secretion system protein E n=1 Tax=Posidoniimonas polymericola TaxID=2528002 RepID=A0A5C5YH16_9BACT|nr:ATPase, T2SS/T4P/T4SS family [Posidoniimonas polymericola]TWT74514.1 putative type II secretion system protein E [Posidoniimonas polymericola]